jgi:hypothetical protein
MSISIRRVFGFRLGSRLVAVFAVVGVWWTVRAGNVAFGREPTTSELARRVFDSHCALLRIPGGIRITYHLYVKQDRRLGHFAWEEGEGEVLICWPQIYSMFRGRHAITHSTVTREGEYNFESEMGAGRDGDFVQIAPFRQVWSAGQLFPLRLQFYDEAEQHFAPGKGSATDYWLPSALDRAQYNLSGETTSGGIVCHVYRRADMLDTIFLAEGHGGVVCERQVRDKTRRLLEATRNTNLKNIWGNVWFPMKQVQEHYSREFVPRWDLSQPTCIITVEVRNISIGKVDKKSMHIQIPKGASVDDLIRKVRYRKAGLGSASLDKGIKQGRAELARAAIREVSTRPRATTIVLCCLFGALSLSTLVLGYQAFKPSRDRVNRR